MAFDFLAFFFAEPGFFGLRVLPVSALCFFDLAAAPFNFWRLDIGRFFFFAGRSFLLSLELLPSALLALVFLAPGFVVFLRLLRRGPRRFFFSPRC